MPNKIFESEIELRFADLDAYGHVNNSTYLTFLETARTKVFLDYSVDFMSAGVLFVVVKVECEYKKPINFGDRVIVKFQVEHFGKTSFDIRYIIESEEGLLFANAKTVMVAVNEKTMSPTALPEEFFAMVAG